MLNNGSPQKCVQKLQHAAGYATVPAIARNLRRGSPQVPAFESASHHLMVHIYLLTKLESDTLNEILTAERSSVPIAINKALS